MVKELIEADELADDAVMVPVDMREATDIDPEQLIEKMGKEKAAELFVNARKRFLEGLQSMPEEAR